MRVVELVIAPLVAAIVVVPWRRLVANPVLPIVATVISDELQVTDADKSLVLLSL